MELRQLRYFLAVAKELHFGRAAKRVHISQPPLSQQIKQLEQELGVQLFTRSKRHVALTDEGREFEGRARAILQHVDEAAEAMKRMARGEKGLLHVGFVGPAMDSRLPELVRAHKERNPDVRMNLLEMGTNEQLEKLRSGDLHVGFLRGFANDLSGLRSTHFWREPHVLALPRGHELAARKHVPIAALEGQPLVMFPRRVQKGLFDAFMACFQEYGFTPNIVQDVVGVQTALALVVAGVGMALLPRGAQHAARPGVEFRPVVGALPTVDISMVWARSTQYAVLEKFLESAEQFEGAFSGKA